jgi:hypothetical protein
MRRFLIAVCLLPLLAGCASHPVVDWDARLGVYTYKQALADSGQPDKTAKLSDGSTVADWQLRGYGASYWGIGYGPYPWSRAYWAEPVEPGGFIGGPGSGDWLRLVFGPDGKLRSYKFYER